MRRDRSLLHGICSFLAFGLLAMPLPLSAELEVKITTGLEQFDVLHHGEIVTVRREQDTFNTFDLDYQMTSRACPRTS
ncbi:hypothetical protein [Thioalkalivibrio sp. HL-Eb18]|uniref:hypothetical protein n=1 Tax=Thioalkalivibrio sp. HL-Eb18 TaxID=1266913 RepID=UPI0018C8CE4E|nr:hypothetical protein [Thioalkalivibrio sp. HL-Eb18]